MVDHGAGVGSSSRLDKSLHARLHKSTTTEKVEVLRQPAQD